MRSFLYSLSTTGISLALCSDLHAQTEKPPAPASQVPVAAQKPAAPAQAPMTLEELQKRLAQMQKSHDADLEDLRAQIDTLEEEIAAAKAKQSTPAQQSFSAFNPGLTVFGNFLARSDDRPVFADDDPTHGRVDDRFNLREVELDFRAPIDPWADGIVIATFEAAQPDEFSAGIEEGYVLLKKLPFLDDAPGGLKLKIGRFRPSFGRLNTIHLHDLPQTSYPISLRNFLGTDGFVADGISGQFFLPSPGEDDTLDATVQILDGGNIAIAPDANSSNIATLAHVNWFHDLAPGHDLNVGVSAWDSNAESKLYGLDATYRWKPYIAGEWKSFLVGTEIFEADLSNNPQARHPYGYDVWTQYQLAQNLYVGVRYDWTEAITDASQKTQTFGAFLTYYTTEFLRFRLGYEHTQSDLAFLDGLDSGFLEINFIYGSHPSEPYWVNR